ncbi:hypothetical protein BLOT_000195 [Blomia tropicalis]|nr:hypothetical protein BLOT_000195 [Blomia tropicalis]
MALNELHTSHNNKNVLKNKSFTLDNLKCLVMPSGAILHSNVVDLSNKRILQGYRLKPSNSEVEFENEFPFTSQSKVNEPILF